MSLSSQQVKDWIFEHLAGHFEKTGELTYLTVDEISEKTDTRLKLVQSLLNEMNEEGVVYGDSQDHYRLTPSTFDELLNRLEKLNRLPEGFNRAVGIPDFPDAPFDGYQMLAHIQSSINNQTKPFNKSEALGLMGVLIKACGNKDDAEFRRISSELETMGCTVRLEPDNEFSVFFPPEIG